MRAIVLASTALVSIPAYAQVSLPATVAVDEGKVASVAVKRPVGIPKGKTLGFTYRTVAETALAGQDYVARSGSQSVRKNASQYTLNIQTINDTAFEQDERLFLEVTAAGVTQRVPIVIRDNDAAPVPDDPHHEEPMPVGGDVLSPTLAGRVPIASPFDPKLGMAQISWSSTKLYGEGIPNRADGWQIAGQDGAFRFTAGGDGPLLYDDPVVYPKQPGASHLHLYFCGVNLNAFSTYESIRANPSSNCSDKTYPLNPSGYWIPPLLCGPNLSQVCRPEYITVYYKGCSARSNSACAPNNPMRKGIKAMLPHGIALVGGWDPTKPNGADGIPNNADDAPGNSYYCSPGNGQHYYNLEDLFRSGGCQVGGLLVQDLVFADCWDGKRLDTANHRDHLVHGGYGYWGYYKCPPTHPYNIPQVQFKPTYTIGADFWAVENGQIVSKVIVASDQHKVGGKPGSSGHADWMPAWDPVAQDMWNGDNGCIGKGLDCVAGDFGNGWGMKGAAPSYGFDLKEDRSAVPARN